MVSKSVFRFELVQSPPRAGPALFAAGRGGAFGRKEMPGRHRVGTRVRGQGKMYILADFRRQVNEFRASEFFLGGEVRDGDFFFEGFERDNAGKTDAQRERARDKEASFRDARIDAIAEGADRCGSRFFQAEKGGIFLALEVQGAPLRDLEEMDFHTSRLS